MESISIINHVRIFISIRVIQNYLREKGKSEWHFTRDIRAEAYENVEQFVAEKIVSQEQSFF